MFVFWDLINTSGGKRLLSGRTFLTPRATTISTTLTEAKTKPTPRVFTCREGLGEHRPSRGLRRWHLPSPGVCKLFLLLLKGQTSQHLSLLQVFTNNWSFTPLSKLALSLFGHPCLSAPSFGSLLPAVEAMPLPLYPCPTPVLCLRLLPGCSLLNSWSFQP